MRCDPADYPQPMMFTLDPAGGLLGDMAANGYAPREIKGTQVLNGNASVTLDVTRDLPKMFYYHSKNAKFIGGMCFVHDGKKHK